MKTLPIRWFVIASMLPLFAGCSAGEQLPDDYTDADRIPVNGNPISDDDAVCGPDKLALRDVKQRLHNREKRCFTYVRDDVTVKAEVEFQADLTVAGCRADDDPRWALPNGSSVPRAPESSIDVRGMLAMSSADGLFSFRVPATLACTQSSCDLLTTVASGTNRGRETRVFAVNGTFDSTSLSLYGGWKQEAIGAPEDPFWFTLTECTRGH